MPTEIMRGEECAHLVCWSRRRRWRSSGWPTLPPLLCSFFYFPLLSLLVLETPKAVDSLGDFPLLVFFLSVCLLGFPCFVTWLSVFVSGSRPLFPLVSVSVSSSCVFSLRLCLGRKLLVCAFQLGFCFFPVLFIWVFPAARSSVFFFCLALPFSVQFLSCFLPLFLLFLPSPVRSSPLFLFEETRGSPCPLLFFFLLSLLSSRFFLVLSSLRMPCGPVLSVFNAGVKAAVFFFSGEEDEQCWGYFSFWSLMFWKFCNQALG